MLLSRVAERIYWLARYLERAEDTTRLIGIHCHVLLDLPFGTELDWGSLLSITSTEANYYSRYKNLTERNVVKFMLSGTANPGSILTALRCARENIRTTRDILPFVVWEDVNELYLFAIDNVEKSLARRDRYKFLEKIGRGCQQIAGLLERDLSRDEAYNFIKLGSHIERADMTTRILDVAASSILHRKQSSSVIDDLLWMGVLQSLHGLAMYRRLHGPKVIAEDVVQFALTHHRFPYAASHSMNEIDAVLKTLKNHEHSISITQSIRRKLDRINCAALMEAPSPNKSLHTFLDQLQVDLIRLNKDIRKTWFEFKQE